MDIVRERLEREYDLELLATMPSVELRGDADRRRRCSTVHNPTDMPDPARIAEIREPLHPRVDPHARRSTSAQIMELCQERRGDARRHALPVRRARAAHLRPAAGRDRARLLRPAEVAHRGYASLDYELDRHARRPTWSSSTSCSPATRSTRCRCSCTATRPTTSARTLTEKLREKIPRQQYDVPIQAAIGVEHHRPRDGQGLPQGRDRQVLRRRHHAASASCSRSRRRASSG